MRKVKLGALMAMLGGSTLFGGCLGGWFQAALTGIPGTVVAEWLLDNDSVFDLFEDGAVTTE